MPGFILQGHNSALLLELQQQRKSSDALNYCNVILILQDKRQLHAHKCVLAAQSRYFERLVNDYHDMERLEVELDLTRPVLATALIDMFYEGVIQLDTNEFELAEVEEAIENLQLKYLDPVTVREYYEHTVYPSRYRRNSGPNTASDFNDLRCVRLKQSNLNSDTDKLKSDDNDNDQTSGFVSQTYSTSKATNGSSGSGTGSNGNYGDSVHSQVKVKPTTNCSIVANKPPAPHFNVYQENEIKRETMTSAGFTQLILTGMTTNSLANQPLVPDNCSKILNIIAQTKANQHASRSLQKSIAKQPSLQTNAMITEPKLIALSPVPPKFKANTASSKLPQNVLQCINTYLDSSNTISAYQPVQSSETEAEREAFILQKVGISLDELQQTKIKSHTGFCLDALTQEEKSDFQKIRRRERSKYTARAYRTNRKKKIEDDQETLKSIQNANFRLSSELNSLVHNLDKRVIVLAANQPTSSVLQDATKTAVDIKAFLKKLKPDQRPVSGNAIRKIQVAKPNPESFSGSHPQRVPETMHIQGQEQDRR